MSVLMDVKLHKNDTIVYKINNNSEILFDGKGKLINMDRTSELKSDNYNISLLNDMKKKDNYRNFKVNSKWIQNSKKNKIC